MIDNTKPREVLDYKLKTTTTYMKEIFGWDEKDTLSYIKSKCKS